MLTVINLWVCFFFCIIILSKIPDSKTSFIKIFEDGIDMTRADLRNSKATYTPRGSLPSCKLVVID